MPLFREKLHLKTAFSYKTVEHSYGNPVIREILEEIFELTQLPIQELKEEFRPDTTGLTPSNKQNYENNRQKTKLSKSMTKFW